MRCRSCCPKRSEISRKIGLRAWILGTTKGHWLALLLAGCGIQILCMFAWKTCGPRRAEKERGVVRAVAVVISIIGFVYCLTFLGMVVELIRSFLLHWKVKYSKVDAQGTMACQTEDKTIFLLEELLCAVQRDEADGTSRCCRRRRRIVILAERPVREMQAEVRLHFRTQDPQGAYKRLRAISYREGCKAHGIELMKVNASAADDILIMCSAETDGSSDHEAIRTLLALGALPGSLQADVWTDPRPSVNAWLVNTILPSAQGIVARHAVNHMITLRALVPSVGYAWLRMSTTRSGTQLFLLPVPPALYGFSLKD
eukprot:g6552.t1